VRFAHPNYLRQLLLIDDKQSMKLYFITGNKDKFEEVGSILTNIEQLDIDLPEIQEIDAKVIIKTKLLQALNHKEAEFILEDTSLYLDCLNGLPGPLIKWFMKTIGNEGLFNIIEKLQNAYPTHLANSVEDLRVLINGSKERRFFNHDRPQPDSEENR